MTIIKHYWNENYGNVEFTNAQGVKCYNHTKKENFEQVLYFHKHNADLILDITENTLYAEATIELDE